MTLIGRALVLACASSKQQQQRLTASRRRHAAAANANAVSLVLAVIIAFLGRGLTRAALSRVRYLRKSSIRIADELLQDVGSRQLLHDHADPSACATEARRRGGGLILPRSVCGTAMMISVVGLTTSCTADLTVQTMLCMHTLHTERACKDDIGVGILIACTALELGLQRLELVRLLTPQRVCACALDEAVADGPSVHAMRPYAAWAQLVKHLCPHRGT